MLRSQSVLPPLGQFASLHPPCAGDCRKEKQGCNPGTDCRLGNGHVRRCQLLPEQSHSEGIGRKDNDGADQILGAAHKESADNQEQQEQKMYQGHLWFSLPETSLTGMLP